MAHFLSGELPGTPRLTRAAAPGLTSEERVRLLRASLAYTYGNLEVRIIPLHRPR